MIFSFAAALLALLLLPGSLELLLVTVGAFLPSKKLLNKPSPIHLVVIIPAHNEEKTIKKTIVSVQKMEGNPPIVVVADNCSDKTAEVAKACQVEVLERRSTEEKGKPFALNFAIKTLLQQNFDWFLILDADSSIDPHFTEEIAHLAANGAKIVQAQGAIRNPEETLRNRLLSIAFFSQYLRMRGRSRLGLSCGIQGTGVALHKEVVDHFPFQGEYITEDLAYHLELIQAGHIVHYAENCKIYSDMPTTLEGSKTQRWRWEGGRLKVAKDFIPNLLKRCLKGQLRFLEPLLDLTLLPLAYHMLVLLFLLLLTGGSTLSLLYLAIPLIHVFFALYLSKASLKDYLALLAAPFYILWKLFQVRKIIQFSQKKEWIRTDRKK